MQAEQIHTEGNFKERKEDLNFAGSLNPEIRWKVFLDYGVLMGPREDIQTYTLLNKF